MTTVSAPHHELALRDGTLVEVRSMHRTDAGRLVRFHRTLSPQTTRLRFFTFHPELSPRELDRFTHVDHRDREALVAIVADEIVAVSRYDRQADGESAEVAFVVADAWQGRGLGSAMFQALAERARAVGIDRLVADTLADNHRMLKVCNRAGLPITQRFEDGLIHVTMELGHARLVT